MKLTYKGEADRVYPSLGVSPVPGESYEVDHDPQDGRWEAENAAVPTAPAEPAQAQPAAPALATSKPEPAPAPAEPTPGPESAPAPEVAPPVAPTADQPADVTTTQGA